MLIFWLLVLAFSCKQGNDYEFTFQNPELSPEERARDLVSRMTLSQKISQMKYDAPAIDSLGVPAYNWWNECLHGVGRAGVATVFPQAIGMSASWNTELIQDIATAISDEARAKHHRFAQADKRGIYMGLTFWTPNINIFRDPRWGRGQETYGEDPFLTGQIATNFIKGLQGDHPKYLKTVATSKHYAVHSGPEPLRHTFDIDVSEKDLYETYLPAFKKTVLDANVQSIMCAYNAFRGDPCCGSNPLLTNILRDDWGFDGYVVSDCWAINDFYEENDHHVVETPEAAAAMAVKAGTDVNCGNTYPYLEQAVEQGLISEEEIDQAVTRLFKARFQLGMFDDPELVEYAQIPYDVVTSQKHLDLALQASREAIVLLKNEDNILPLSKDIQSIAVIGPNAHDHQVMLGNYHGTPTQIKTVLEGIKEEVGSQVQVNYAEGSFLVEGYPSLKPVPSSALTPEGNSDKNGLKAEYFNNEDLSGDPEIVRTDTAVDIFWYGKSPLTNIEADTFSVRWTGALTAPKSGTYTIGFNAAHGATAYFDGEKKFEFYNVHHPGTRTFQVELEQGKSYPIRLELINRGTDPQAHLLWALPDRNLETEALAAARESDVVVMVMGLHPRIEGEEMDVKLPGFAGGDRTDIKLPEIQTELIRKIHALGKPTVLVMMAGSAVAFNWANHHIPGILYAWYPGEYGGNAIADVLFGNYSPSGRLPVTLYQSVEDLPEFTNYDMQNRTYKYFEGEPLYPFGFGLSYTTFEYDQMQMPTKVTAESPVTVSVSVENKGNRAGEEVVQLYVKDPEASFVVPVRSLRAFQKVRLEPGETKEISFTLQPQDYAMVNDEGKLSIEPGEYIISIGGEQPGFSGKKNASTTDVVTGAFQVEGSAKVIQ